RRRGAERPLLALPRAALQRRAEDRGGAARPQGRGLGRRGRDPDRLRGSGDRERDLRRERRPAALAAARPEGRGHAARAAGQLLTLPERAVTLGFRAAAFVNVAGILLFSLGLTNTALIARNPVVFSRFGLVCIMLWGLAYLAVARAYAQVPLLVAVFAVEKL